MAKKIKFPLKMKNGVPVRSIEELRENFCLSSMLLYLANGKLVTWLRDRYLNELADKIAELDENDMEICKKLCDIFEISYEDNLETANYQKKIMLLKKYTMESELFQVIDHIAFNDSDLTDLLNKGEKIIYLCNGRFSIPLNKSNIHYIGIAKPTAVIGSDKKVDFDKKGIIFEDINFDDGYKKVIAQQEEKENRNIQNNFSYANTGKYTFSAIKSSFVEVSKTVNEMFKECSQQAGRTTEVHRQYLEEDYLKTSISERDDRGSRELSEKDSADLKEVIHNSNNNTRGLVKMVKQQIDGLDYDINADIVSLREMVKKSGLLNWENPFSHN